MKKYLKKYLKKSFIILNKILFINFILFVKKLTEVLYFYINYR